MGTSTRVWAGPKAPAGRPGTAPTGRGLRDLDEITDGALLRGAREHVGARGVLSVVAASCAERPAPFANEGA